MGDKKEKSPHKDTKNSKKSQRWRFFVTSLRPLCLCEEIFFRLFLCSGVLVLRWPRNPGQGFNLTESQSRII